MLSRSKYQGEEAEDEGSRAAFGQIIGAMARFQADFELNGDGDDQLKEEGPDVSDEEVVRDFERAERAESKLARCQSDLRDLVSDLLKDCRHPTVAYPTPYGPPKDADFGGIRDHILSHHIGSHQVEIGRYMAATNRRLRNSLADMKADALLQAEQINRLTLELEALRFSTAGPNAELSRDLVKMTARKRKYKAEACQLKEICCAAQRTSKEFECLAEKALAEVDQLTTAVIVKEDVIASLESDKNALEADVSRLERKTVATSTTLNTLLTNCRTLRRDLGEFDSNTQRVIQEAVLKSKTEITQLKQRFVSGLVRRDNDVRSAQEEADRLRLSAGKAAAQEASEVVEPLEDAVSDSRRLDQIHQLSQRLKQRTDTINQGNDSHRRIPSNGVIVNVDIKHDSDPTLVWLLGSQTTRSLPTVHPRESVHHTWTHPSPSFSAVPMPLEGPQAQFQTETRRLQTAEGKLNGPVSNLGSVKGGHPINASFEVTRVRLDSDKVDHPDRRRTPTDEVLSYTPVLPDTPNTRTRSPRPIPRSTNPSPTGLSMMPFNEPSRALRHPHMEPLVRCSGLDTPSQAPLRQPTSALPSANSGERDVFEGEQSPEIRRGLLFKADPGQYTGLSSVLRLLPDPFSPKRRHRQALKLHLERCSRSERRLAYLMNLLDRKEKRLKVVKKVYGTQALNGIPHPIIEEAERAVSLHFSMVQGARTRLHVAESDPLRRPSYFRQIAESTIDDIPPLPMTSTLTPSSNILRATLPPPKDGIIPYMANIRGYGVQPELHTLESRQLPGISQEEGLASGATGRPDDRDDGRTADAPALRRPFKLEMWPGYTVVEYLQGGDNDIPEPVTSRASSGRDPRSLMPGLLPRTPPPTRLRRPLPSENSARDEWQVSRGESGPTIGSNAATIELNTSIDCSASPPSLPPLSPFKSEDDTYEMVHFAKGDPTPQSPPTMKKISPNSKGTANLVVSGDLMVSRIRDAGQTGSIPPDVRLDLEEAIWAQGTHVESTSRGRLRRSGASLVHHFTTRRALAPVVGTEERARVQGLSIILAGDDSREWAEATTSELAAAAARVVPDPPTSRARAGLKKFIRELRSRTSSGGLE